MRQKDFLPYLVCFAAGLFSFYDVFQLTLFNVISKSLLTTFSFNHFTLGLFSATFLLANALWIIPAGRLLDRYPARTVGLVFFGLAILATLILALSHYLWLSSIARIIQGMASAVSLLLCTRIASVWFEDAKGCAIGSMFAMASLGGLCANTFWPVVVNIHGWRLSLMISAAVGMAFYVYVWCFLRAPEYVTNTISPLKRLRIPSISINLVTLGIYIGLMSLPLFILGALWGNNFIAETYHFSLAQAGSVTGMLFWGMLLGMPFIGSLNDSMQKPYLIMGSGPLICAFLILLLMVDVHISLLALMIIFLLIGFVSSCQGLAFVTIAHEYSLVNRSTAIAIAALAENLIGTVAQPLFGKIVDIGNDIFMNSPLGWHYRFALLILPIGFFVCTLIVIMLKFQSSSRLNREVFNHAIKY